MNVVSVHPKYRPDIDGLRAIAVLAVVLYHAFPNHLRGGFVGVDVFFVISGFLISKIILSNLENNTFSFADFYSRRIRRIFPALIIVMAACLIYGWFSLLPNDLVQLSKHIIGGAAFVSNFILWQEVGYFDNAAETKPFLHLWSLGIEEQFYIFWPLIAWIIWRSKKRYFFKILIFLALLSFLLCLSQTKPNPTMSFYSPLARFWEIFLGSALAYMSEVKSRASEKLFNRYNNIKSLLGFILICLAIFLIRKQDLFPGWRALLPTLGAFLIIAAGPKAWINQNILSKKILVWVGLISFPLYLWHWPLLVFTRARYLREAPDRIIVVVVILSFLLSWLTYIFIEKRIRYLKFKLVPVVLACGLGLLSAISYIAMLNQGFVHSWQDAALVQLKQVSWDETYKEVASKYPPCLPIDIQKKMLDYGEYKRCRQTKVGNPNHTVVLIGDSHAEHLYSGIAEFISKNENFVYYTHVCLPFIGLEGFDCANMNENLIRIINQPSVHTVILAQYWTYLFGFSKMRLIGNSKITSPQEVFKQAMADTLKAFSKVGKRVIIVHDTPILDFDPKKCIQTPFQKQKSDCFVTKEYVLEGRRVIEEMMSPILKQFTNVMVWDPIDYLCEKEKCHAVAEDQFKFIDNNHITISSSKLLGEPFVKAYNLN